MNLGIVYTPTRVDIYKDGDFSSSLLATPHLPLPIEDTQVIEAYVCKGSVDQFAVAIKGEKYRGFDGPCLIETDEDLIVLRCETVIRIPLRHLYAASLNKCCDDLDCMQQQAGFFPMNQSQKEAAINYLFVCFQELVTRPKVLCVPVFAWFNYALLDESEVDDSSVLDHIEILGTDLFDEATKLVMNSLPEQLRTDIPKRRLFRSALLRETFNLLES